MDAKKQLDELVFSPYGAGVTNTDSDAIKINKILNFIDSNIIYQSDMQETPQSTGQTLTLQSGDCKDYSILASAAFADAGIPSAIMRMENVSGQGPGHAMVLIQSSENLPLYGYYSNLMSIGLPTGRWWVIEPQYTFVQQSQNPSWFTQWNIVNAAVVGQAVSGGSSPAIPQASTDDTDEQLMADAGNIKGALELYYNDKGAYPTGVSNWSQLVSILAAQTGINSVTLENDLPQGMTYGYASNGTTYVLGVELEDPNDSPMQYGSVTSMPSGLNWMILPEGGQNGTTCGTAGLYCADILGG